MSVLFSLCRPSEPKHKVDQLADSSDPLANEPAWVRQRLQQHDPSGPTNSKSPGQDGYGADMHPTNVGDPEPWHDPAMHPVENLGPPGPPSLLTIVNMMHRSHDGQAAEEAVLNALRFNPQDPDAIFMLAWQAGINEKNYDLADVYLRQVLATCPAHIDALVLHAYILADRGNRPAAQVCHARAQTWCMHAHTHMRTRTGTCTHAHRHTRTHAHMHVHAQAVLQTIGNQEHVITYQS